MVVFVRFRSIQELCCRVFSQCHWASVELDVKFGAGLPLTNPDENTPASFGFRSTHPDWKSVALAAELSSSQSLEESDQRGPSVGGHLGQQADDFQ